MDDLTAKLNEILSDPESMQQIRAIADSLNLVGGNSSPQETASPDQKAEAEDEGSKTPKNSTQGSPPFDLSMLQNLIGALGGAGNQNTENGSNTGASPGIDPALLQTLMSAMGGGGGQNAGNGNSQSGSPAINPAMLQTLMSAMGSGGQSAGNSDSGSGGPAINPAMLQTLMSALGGSGGQSAGNGDNGSGSPAINPAMLQTLMSSLGGGQNAAGGGTTPPAGGMDPAQMMQIMNMVSKMAPLMQRMNEEDDSTRLLYALRPLLSEKRQSKLDEATKIMRMMRMIPLLKESGMLSTLF